ncbi:MAG TPA: glycosyltransferase [Gaiellaceae bacterium]|nr:glycosyltransferase [Gaiellaceae bacterium]
MVEPLTILVAARDEEARIGDTVKALKFEFPGAEVLVADDGSRDATAAAAERAGARVLRLPRLGKGQALTLAEREARAGPLLLCDADIDGDLRPLLEEDADLAVAAFAERRGGGFGIAKRTARALVRGCSGFAAREPLSGQRALSPIARETCFPLAPGFGCEVRMTIDAANAGLRVRELELPLRHRPTGLDVRGFLHRGRQLLDALLACGPTALNHRGLRLPLVGVLVAAGGRGAARAVRLSVAGIALLGLADDLWSGPERGFRAHLRRGRTTGALKAAGIPLLSLAATRSLPSALLVSLSANGLNLLDTRPGRALKAFLAGAALVRGPTRAYAPIAVLLAPYDLREMTMLGDAGSNALGAVLGYGSVATFTARGRRLAVAALAAFTFLGETRSLGETIERTPGLSHLDRLGRPA